MDKGMIVLDVVKEALRVNYEFRVEYSKFQSKFNSRLEQKTIHGTVFRSIELEFSDYLRILPNVAKQLQQDNISLLVTFDKQTDKYQAMFLEKIIKGPALEDEYWVAVDQFLVWESSPKNALEVMEIMVADELAVSNSQVKNRSHKKKKVPQNYNV